MDYSYEKNLQDQGFQLICGIDEAGRGPFAGPIVAGAVILNSEKNSFFDLLKDSKVLTEKKREQVLPFILQESLAWAIGVVSAAEIDKHGLGYANKLAMKKAWYFLKVKPNYILCDYMAGVKFETPHELIIGGDSKVISISAASIVAKVFRDRMMLAFDRKYPEYGFAKHKGYGTKVHLEKIKELGYCPIHRRSFRMDFTKGISC
ncbi:MAG: ribonuclease HII [Patescibacteria group bacterium]